MSTQVATIMQVPTPATAMLHVLAVDDDPAIRGAIADYLGKHEFRVTAVADGAAMQAVLAQELVDVVGLDLELQAEDRMGLGRRLRHESATPLMSPTGRTQEAEQGKGRGLS